MKFTDGDADMIRWINGHGFAAIHQTARWMGSCYQAVQRRTQVLAEKPTSWSIDSPFAVSGSICRPSAPWRGLATSYRRSAASHSAAMSTICSWSISHCSSLLKPVVRSRQNEGFGTNGA